MRGRPSNENREIAILLGETTYIGSPHDCGYTERYVKGCACVHCARQRQREQREVHGDLRARPEIFSEHVRVGVAREEHHLEEQHAGRPDRGAAAEPR